MRLEIILATVQMALDIMEETVRKVCSYIYYLKTDFSSFLVLSSDEIIFKLHFLRAPYQC